MKVFPDCPQNGKGLGAAQLRSPGKDHTLVNTYQHQYGKVLTYAVGVEVHLPSHWPLNLWGILIRYLRTQSHCDIRVSTVYLHQILPKGTYLLTNSFERMNSWVSCALTTLENMI